MNVKKRINLFFEELIEAIEEGIDAIGESDNCDDKIVYIDVTVGYRTSELRRKEDKIELYIGTDDLEEKINKEKIFETLEAINNAVGVNTAEEEI